MLQKVKIPSPALPITSVANPNFAGKKTISIYLAFLTFTLLSLNKCLSNPSEKNTSFLNLKKAIQLRKFCDIKYNTSKAAAIVSLDCTGADYINFKTHQTYHIIDNWSNVRITWLSNTIAQIDGPCGTGCSTSIIFIAPATSVACATHEYRINNMSPNEPPDFYSNRPLLVDPNKKIAVCYDDQNKIQVMPLPIHASIQPPKGYYAEKAEIHNGKLLINYHDKRGNLSSVAYEIT